METAKKRTARTTYWATLPIVLTLTLPRKEPEARASVQVIVLESGAEWALGAVQNTPQTCVLKGQRQEALIHLLAPIPLGQGVPSGNTCVNAGGHRQGPTLHELEKRQEPSSPREGSLAAPVQSWPDKKPQKKSNTPLL